MLGGFMAVDRSTIPITISGWWEEIAGMSLEVEQKLQKEFQDGESNDSKDFQEFKKAKEIYGKMATYGQLFFDPKHSSVNLDEAIEKESERFNVDAKGQKVSVPNGQLQIMGPLTHALAKKYLELQNKFIAKEKEIEKPSDINALTFGAVKKEALDKAKKRRDMLQAAVDQYESVELKKAEDKKSQDAAVDPIPSSIPPPTPSSTSQSHSPNEHKPSSTLVAEPEKKKENLNPLGFLMKENKKDPALTEEQREAERKSKEEKLITALNEDNYYKKLNELLDKIHEKKSIDIDKNTPEANKFLDALSILEKDVINAIIEREVSLRGMKDPVPVKELNQKQVKILDRYNNELTDIEKIIELQLLQKKLYDSLQAMIKDHEAWSNQVEHKKFGGGKSIIVADGKTDKVPTGIESMMRCLSVGAAEFEKKESSNLERFRRPFYDPVKVEDIGKKRPPPDAKAIVADLKALNGIAFNRLAKKSLEEQEKSPVGQFYSSLSNLDLNDPVKLTKCIEEVNEIHGNLGKARSEPADKKAVRKT